MVGFIIIDYSIFKYFLTAILRYIPLYFLWFSTLLGVYPQSSPDSPLEVHMVQRPPVTVPPGSTPPVTPGAAAALGGRGPMGQPPVPGPGMMTSLPPFLEVRGVGVMQCGCVTHTQIYIYIHTFFKISYVHTRIDRCEDVIADVYVFTFVLIQYFFGLGHGV